MFTRIATCAALMLTAAIPAQAGGFAAAVTEVIVVEEQETTRSSAAFIIIPLVLVALIALASSDDASEDDGGFQESDMRLKTDILQVGHSPSGLPIYQFRYIGETQLYQGVMAQDVLLHTPSAVRLNEFVTHTRAGIIKLI